MTKSITYLKESISVLSSDIHTLNRFIDEKTEARHELIVALKKLAPVKPGDKITYYFRDGINLPKTPHKYYVMKITVSRSGEFIYVVAPALQNGAMPSAKSKRKSYLYPHKDQHKLGWDD